MNRVVAVSLFAILAIVFGHGQARADGPNRAGIVIEYGDMVQSTCVEFDEPEITGGELLSRAGFPVVAEGSGLGTAVCSIDGVGCGDSNNCWCQCHGATCRYWAYFTLGGGEWTYSAVGAARRKVHNGDVDGWIWGVGGAGSAVKPAATSFDEVCPAEAPEMTPVPLPASTAAASTEGAVEAPAAPRPSATAVTGTPAATRTPVATIDSGASSKEEAGPGFPRQLPAFALVAGGLLGIAGVLARRRSRG